MFASSVLHVARKSNTKLLFRHTRPQIPLKEVVPFVVFWLRALALTRAENSGRGDAKTKTFLSLEYIFALHADIVPIFGGLSPSSPP